MKLISVIVRVELLAVPEDMLITSEESVWALTSSVRLPVPKRLPTVRDSKVVFFISRVLEFVLRLPVTETPSVTATEADCRTVEPVP